MRFLVIFQTLLAAAIAAKLPTYSLPSQQHQPNVGTPLPSPPARPSGQQIQPHVDQNSLTQTYESAGQHIPQKLHGPAGGNGLTHTFEEATRPQDPFQFQGLTGHDVFIQTFDETVGPAQGFVRPTESNDLNQILDESKGPFAPTQPQGTNGQNFFESSSVQPQGPTQPKGPAGLVLGGSCPQGQVVHADGSCAVPEVTRDLYVFSIPDTPRRPSRPPPTLPPPRVHEHVLFIRAPEGGHTAQPLLVPPPAQKSVVYILREDSPDEEPRVIQAPAPPPARPEVFFVNYEDGENPALHGGLDLQQVLQTVTSAPPALHDAAVPEHVQEAPQQQTHSQQGAHAGGDLVLEDNSDEDLTLGGFSAHDATLGGHSDGTFALGGHIDGNQQPETYTNGNQQSGSYNNGDQQSGSYNNGDQQSGSYNNGDQQSGSYNNGNQQPESYSNGIRQLEAHKNDNQQLGGHNNDHLGLTVVFDDDFELGEHFDHDVSLEGHSDDTFVQIGQDDISLEDHTDDDFRLRHHSHGDLVLGSQADNTPTNIVQGVQRDQFDGQTLSHAQETFAETPTGFAFQNSGDFDSDNSQEKENGGYAVPATLLGANFGSRDNRFNRFVDGEEAARGAVDIVTDAAARFNGDIYGPPTASPAPPSLLYSQP
ncbi:uncharacterized protein LOC123519595 [Portunus trituberculatus]|uniref:uncharacterized protein LOC123519595 n=1 Tax=Portunus trituberculatus TaxID=210409 RepID=UPI001E1D0C92|nr:uncharacterized protein LOC123519595 [Portunus trituberculatus]